jgi:MFS family permease
LSERTVSRTSDEALLGRAETWALVGCQPLAQLSNMALVPSLGSMRADLGLSYVELGWVVAAFGIARLITDLPAGGLASRWNPRAVLLVAFAASGAASALGVLATNGLQLGGVRLLIGAASSVAQAMLLAWLVGGSGRAARGRVMARGEAFFSLSGLIVPAVGGVLASSLGWRVAFGLGALAALGGLFAVLLFTRSRTAALAVGFDERSHESSAPRWRDLRMGGAVLLAAYVSTFVVFFTRNGLLNSVVPVLGTDQHGFEPFQIGLLFSALNAISIGAVLLGGRLADRFGRAQSLAPGMALYLVGQVLWLVVHDQTGYVIVGLLQGVTFAVFPLPTTLMGDALPPRLRARGIAVYRATADVAILTAPAACGIALELGGFVAAEVLTIAVNAAALALIVVVPRLLGQPYRSASSS